MPFDALGILKGLYSEALVEVDESDTPGTSVDTVTSYGNLVIDVKKTGVKGLAAVLIWTALSTDADPYSDEGTILIEASDELDRGWLEVARFETQIPYLIRLKDCAVSAGHLFVASDVTTPRVFQGTTDADAAGLLHSVDQALFSTGGIGDIVIKMESAVDVYDTAGDVLKATAGTGWCIQGAKGVPEVPQMIPGIHVVRFTTNKRYVRVNCEAVEDALGTAWILLTNWAFNGI